MPTPRVRPILGAALLALTGCARACSNGGAPDAGQVAPAPPVQPEAASEAFTWPPLEARVPSPVPAPRPIGFDWSPPCEVSVVQRVEKGVKSVYRMTRRVARRGEEQVVRFDDLRLESLDGLERLTPEEREVVRAGLTTPLPAVRLDAAGAFLGIEGAEAAVDALRKSQAEAGATKVPTPAVSAAMKAAVEHRMQEDWGGWIGAWIGAELAPGATRRTESEVPLLGGRTAKVPTEVKHHGEVIGFPKLVLLSLETTFEGEAAIQALSGAMDDLTKSAGTAPLPSDTLKGARMKGGFTVAMEPARGRPHRARYELVVRVGTQEQREVRDTLFVWGEARGCGGR